MHETHSKVHTHKSGKEPDGSLKLEDRDEQDIEGSAVVTKPKKDKKNKKRAQALDNAEEDLEPGKEGKKEKKRKRVADDDDRESHSRVKNAKKKKHENNTGFPDPSNDTALSSQASKGLTDYHCPILCN